MHNLYIDSSWLAGLPDACHVFNITPLLRELIVKMVQYGRNYGQDSPAMHLAHVLVDQLQESQTIPLSLPYPTDKRLITIHQALLEAPDDNRSLVQWGQLVGASDRTLNRLFQKQTGMGFQAWRQHLRLMLALERLSQGHSITRIALEVGYSSTSAFVHMFKKVLSTTPGKFLLS